jgi:hypothetical protein
VDASATAADCDAAYVALPMIATLAGAIGNTRRVVLKRNWTEPAIVWAALIGDSGVLKSPAIDPSRDYVLRRQARFRKDFAAKMKEYEKAKEQGEKPEKPILDRCLVDDTTVEALGPILVDNWRGVLILRDELAGWLGSFDRYAKGSRGAGDAAKWIEMHGGRSVIIDRRTGEPRTLFVPRAAVSIGGGIQPGIIRRLMIQDYHENGLLARLLMAWPPRRPRRWTDAEPDETITAAVQSVYDNLWSGLKPTTDREGNPVPISVPLTAPAKSAFIAFVNEHGAEQYRLDGDLAAAWSKLEGYAARLALIHHLVRWAAGDRNDPERGIDLESIQAGIALVRWFGAEDRRVYAMLAEADTDTEQRKLIDLIRRHGGAITVRQLMQASRQYPSAEVAEGALNGLVAAKKAIWEIVKHDRGRPAHVARLL